MAGVQLSVQVRGELVRKGLQDLTDREAPKIGRQQVRVTMERIKRRMEAYPPEPPGQSITEVHAVLGTIYRPAKGRYRRTGRLGRSWMIEALLDNKGYRISNTAAHKGRFYAPYVVGNAYGLRQAWMHKGRWQLLRDVTEEEVGRMIPAIREHIVMAARRKGFA